MINNILVGLVAVQTVCVCAAVYKISKATNGLEIATLKMQIATVRIEKAEKAINIGMREMKIATQEMELAKDEVIKNFTNEIRKQAFNLSFFGIRMR